jgi:hypothetical protein
MDKTLRRLRLLVPLAALTGSCSLFPLAALASPTANEFAHCHQLAARLLEACLSDHAGQPSTPCWSRAKNANSRCYAELFASHRRNQVPGKPD